MITLLVVGPRQIDAVAAPPSVELLRATTPEEALETLSRNRRIDAVLFLDDRSAEETVRVLAEEGVSWPPLFQAGRSSAPGVVALDPGSILADLRKRLGE